MSSPTGPQWQPPAGPPHQGPPEQPAHPQQGAAAQPGQWGQHPEQQPQQWGQPQQPQQWGQPQQPQWGQPTGAQPTQQFGQPAPAWGQPTGAQPTPGWAQPTGGQPAQSWNQPTGAQPGQWGPQGQPGYGPPPQYGQPGSGAGEPPKKNNKGILITAVAVVIALVAGLGVWFFAIRDSNEGGQDTPAAAAAQLFADIDNGDLVGLASTFDPVEAEFVTDLATDVIDQFKRLGLLNESATVNNATGASVSMQGITFDDAAAERPLEDLTIVKLTGGTITFTPTENADIQTDLYSRLVDAVSNLGEDQGLPMGSASEPTTIDIAQVIREENDGEPIRISTVLRDGSWYPSLFYTAADYWAQEAASGPVTAADAIPGAGKESPEAAVDAMIDAIIQQNATDVIALLPPDEMAAVHTYGTKIVDAIGPGSPSSDVSFRAEWSTSDVTGGTMVSIKSLEITADGETGKIEIDKDAGSLTVTQPDGSSETFDADNIGDLVGEDLSDIHPDFPDFLSRMMKAGLGLGLVTTEVDGSWYVSPLRSYSGVFTTLLGGMQQSDIEMFIDLMNQ